VAVAGTKPSVYPQANDNGGKKKKNRLRFLSVKRVSGKMAYVVFDGPRDGFGMGVAGKFFGSDP